MEPKIIRLDHCVFCFFLYFLLFVSRFSLAMSNFVFFFIILMYSVFIYSSFQAAMLQFFNKVSWVSWVEYFVNSSSNLMHDNWHDMAQTMRHLAVLTDFVPLKWYDLARHIAGHTQLNSTSHPKVHGYHRERSSVRAYMYVYPDS